MLITSIQLTNFRQFKDAHIDFADCKEHRNVSLIIGENSAGKSTILRAFTWCLYGITEFNNQSLLNKKVEQEIKYPTDHREVEVIVCLNHCNEFYEIHRRQMYKLVDNEVKANTAEVYILHKDISGNTNRLEFFDFDNTIKKILNKDLYKYFFFSGEQIDTMSKEVYEDKKSTEFAYAVKSILGLKGIQDAIDHIGGKNGVISSFNRELKNSSDDKISKIYTEIEESNICKDQIENDLNTLIKEIENGNNRISHHRNEILLNQESKRIQEQINETEENIKFLNNLNNNTANDAFKLFQDNYLAFFINSLFVKKSLNFLKDLDLKDSDIPSITADTLNYLIKRGYCICGEPLDKDSKALDEIKKLFDLIPPKSLGNTIGDFKHEFEKIVAGNNYHWSLATEIEEKYNNFSKNIDEIEINNKKKESLEGQLLDKKLGDVVNKLQIDIKSIEDDVAEKTKERDNLNQKLGVVNNKLKDLNEKAQVQAEKTAQTQKTQEYLNYAKAVLEQLNETYNTKETEIRSKLENNINEIFKQSFKSSKISLKILEDYTIRVISEESSFLELSSSQSITVILAFIGGVIKLAKEQNNKDSNHAITSDATYPLVMDAPFSSFDNVRIKEICETLPNLAEELIILIKDLDGNLANQYLSSRIGKRYVIKKLDDFESVIEEQ